MGAEELAGRVGLLGLGPPQARPPPGPWSGERLERVTQSA